MEVSEDGKTYYPAQTEVSGNKIKITSKEISATKYVRYCWKNSSKGTIFNSEGLPLAPFKLIVKKD